MKTLTLISLYLISINAESNIKNAKSILLDDLIQKPVRNGSPLEILTLLIELSMSNDPFMRFFFMFIIVFICIPFVGGCVILFLNFTKEDKNQPVSAFSWIPFIGVLANVSHDPFVFFKTQASRSFPAIGLKNETTHLDMFRVDTIVRETTCLYGKDGVKEFLSGIIFDKQCHGHLLYMGNQMGPLFDGLYRTNISFYLKHSRKVFKNEKFWQSQKDGLTSYISGRLNKISATCSRLDLTLLSSSLYLDAILFLFLGERFLEKHGEDLTNNLHTIQMNMKFTFLRFLGSFGIPTGTSSQNTKIAKKIKELLQDEIDQRQQGPQKAVPDYLDLMLDVENVPSEFQSCLWSHLCHLILVTHAPSVSILVFTIANRFLMKDIVAKAHPIKSYMLESARLYSPPQISCLFQNKTMISGFNFPPGSTAFICPGSTHFAPEFYSQPKSFVPERWIKKSTEQAMIDKGALVTPFAESAYGSPLCLILKEITEEIIHCVEEVCGEIRIGTNRVKPLAVDYWAAVNAAWPSGRVIFKFLETKKDK